MIRRFNYTGRRRILREHACVTVRQEVGSAPTFSIDLALERYGLPPHAQVFVEAYRQTSFLRFPWGTVSCFDPPLERSLAEFGLPDGVLFRVKVVEPSADLAGRPAVLLALADQLRPREVDSTDSQAESLLPLVPKDLDEIWRVDFPADGGEPVLEVNQNLVETPGVLGRSEQFVSLVLPEALRIVLSQVLIVEGYDSGEEGDDWRALWLRMARLTLSADEAPYPQRSDTGVLENRNELDRWIDEVVARFSRRFKVGRRFRDWWDEGQGE